MTKGLFAGNKQVALLRSTRIGQSVIKPLSWGLVSEATKGLPPTQLPAMSFLILTKEAR